MIEELPLGRKLYAFREDRKISQTKVEVETGLSFGTISRIENNVINPTKETLNRISTFLRLDSSEFNYLIGFNSVHPSRRDIDCIINRLKKNLSETDFPAYIIDSTFRIWYCNDLILKLFDISEDQRRLLIGETYMRVLFSPEVKIIEKVPKDKLLEVIKKQVWRYRKMIGKYRLETSTIEEVNRLKQNPLFNQVWQEYLATEEDLSLGDDFYYEFCGKILSILITMNEVQFDNRFILVRFYPKNYKTARIFESLRTKGEKRVPMSV